MSLFFLWLVSYYVGTLGTHTEIKRVAEEKVTLPCHHQLGLPEKDTLDIEWLLTDNEGNQKVVSTPLAIVALLSALTSPSLAFTSFLMGLEEFVFSPNSNLNELMYKTREKGPRWHTLIILALRRHGQ